MNASRAGGSLRSTALVVGRDDELRRLEAAHAEVPVAVIYGVPGVGKSTLAIEYASRWTGPVAYVKLHAETTIAELAEAVHRTLSVARYDVAVDDRERLDDVWILVERFGCLAVVDDLHLLPLATRHLIIDTAAHALRRARFVAVSRELVPMSPATPDRLQLRLEPLERTSARVLWDRLIELYGPGRDFEVAWLRSRGNPFLLRQAHAGALVEAHLLEPAVRALQPQERRLANVLAVARKPLPHDVVSRLPEPDVDGSLRTLVTRLIVDVTSDDRYLMHDLWREVVTRDLDRDAAQLAAAALVVALHDSQLDALTKVQELSWHLRRLGRHAEIGALLLTYSAELVRHGATAELLRELDELPASALTTELRVLRARTLARCMQPGRAYAELRSLVERGNVSPQLCLFLASSATVTGELDHAHLLLEQLVQNPALDPGLRAAAQLGLAWNLANRGHGVDGPRLLDDLEASTQPPPQRSLPLRLFLLALDREFERAADLAIEWLNRRVGGPEDLWSRMVTPVLCVATLAAAGRFEAASEVVKRMEQGLHSPAECLELSWTRMTVRYEKGERAAPLEYFHGAQRLLERGGHFAGAIWTRAITCRLLFLLGRRREALAGLTSAADACRRHQTSAFDRVIEAAAVEDPLLPGWLGRPAAMRPGDPRAAVTSLLRIACARGTSVQSGLPKVDLPPSADFGFDRALVELASAIVAHRHGQQRVASQHLRAAVAHAATAGADDDVIPQLHDALTDLLSPPRCASGSGDLTASLVIDGVRHEIRAGTRRLPLSARPVLRQLLYAFAGAPAHHLTCGMIAHVLWNADYDPLRHENTLKSNIRRLRALLAGIAEIQSEHAGYHLVLPDDVLFIPPADN